MSNHDPLQIKRRIPVRVSFGILAVICFFATLWLLGQYEHINQTEAWSALRWLIGTISVVVGCDMVRPSGQKVSAFTVPAIPGIGVKAPAE